MTLFVQPPACAAAPCDRERYDLHVKSKWLLTVTLVPSPIPLSHTPISSCLRSSAPAVSTVYIPKPQCPLLAATSSAPNACRVNSSSARHVQSAVGHKRLSSSFVCTPSTARRRWRCRLAVSLPPAPTTQHHCSLRVRSPQRRTGQDSSPDAPPSPRPRPHRRLPAQPARRPCTRSASG